MKLWELALAIGGAICLLLGTAWIRRSELPRRDFVLDAGRLPGSGYRIRSAGECESRCVTEAHRPSTGRGTLWCYTERLVDCVGVPTNLTRGMKKIAIVGGGPAGALCGERLATAGFEVTIFDERLAWEKPCGGGLNA